MSKADQLGTGRFGATARPVSARRAAIGAATGVPTEGVAPPTRLPLDRISPNPDNPRTSLGDLTELTGSLREHGQKQAITVMNRDAYVKANPEREAELAPDATHVVVDGSSRLAAAREAGLTHLNVMVDDDQGADSEAILESALVANVHRQELEPLDEARALQRLLAIHGTQTKLAKRLHKSQGWVSQRLALLNLAPELQERIGEERIDLLRAVGNKPPEEQEAALEALKREQARAEAEKAERRRERQAAAVEEPADADQPTAAHRATAADPSPTAAAAPVSEDAAATGQASDRDDTPGRADDFSSSSHGFSQAPSSGGGEEPRQPEAGGGEGQAPSDADEARAATETEHGADAEAEGAQPPAVSAEATQPARATGRAEQTGRTEQTERSGPAASAVPGPAESQDNGEQRPVSPAHLTPVPAAGPSGPSSALAAPVSTASVDGVPEPRGAGTDVDGDHAESEHPQEERVNGDHTGPDAALPPRLPYDDGVFLAHHLIRKMPDTAFDRMLELLNEHQRQRDAARQDSA
ncbi:ParB/RepB/Spo0J family partition protein [Streptomyces sp. NPDC014748]|uniref:ParB/RepB/Spo0J family partition protein n=1 Tax=Streptomyces sp. NPDC014748 TaxID=3364905 RepID=UPI0036F6EF55